MISSTWEKMMEYNRANILLAPGSSPVDVGLDSAPLHLPPIDLYRPQSSRADLADTGKSRARDGASDCEFCRLELVHAHCPTDDPGPCYRCLRTADGLPSEVASLLALLFMLAAWGLVAALVTYSMLTLGGLP